jgi:peptidoglycan/LPS O-acetylase OafA/YrhL
MKIRYRPEIDGLRAVSVFAVIIYHANFVLYGHALFEGGFIGVDIFFIISGYLITTLILKEIFRTNRFSFKIFYERRIRRILPTLLFVVIITSIISFFILLPSSLIDYGRSVLSTVSFVSNFYFHYTDNAYEQKNSLLKPLLHTWSLSVEEQFYILFPIFLIIINKFFRKHLLKFLFFIFMTSLLFSVYFSKTHPSFNFYIILSRGFELLLGSLLSYFELNNGGGRRKSYSILNQICPSLGIVLILYSFLFFNFIEIFHPSIITLIPIIGILLILRFSNKGEFVTDILSSQIFVRIGLISYSLYLWHYPIFAYLRYICIFNNSIWIKLLGILLTIILSILSYYFIEKPFRNKNIITTKMLGICIFVSAIILLSYSFYILKTEGIKSRYPNLISETLNKTLNDNEQNRLNGNSERTVFLVGDSHSNVLAFNLNKELTSQSYNFYKKNTIFYLKNFNLIEKKGNRVNKNYIEENIDIDKFLQEHKNIIVVWHQRWSPILLEEYFDNKEVYSEYNTERDRELIYKIKQINIVNDTLNERQKYIIEGIKSSAKNILKKGNSLILVYPVPEMGFDVPRLVLKNYLTNKIKNKNKNIETSEITISYNVYKKRNKKIFDTLDSIQGPNVYRVFPDKSFCNNVIVNRCIANNKKHLFYSDDNHLSFEGSKYIVSDIMKVIQKIEVDKKIISIKAISFKN